MPRSNLVCFDCPFIRGSDSMEMSARDMENFVWKHLTDSGHYEEFPCVETGSMCNGQVQVVCNGHHSGIDPFSDFGEAVEESEPNSEKFFRGPWEFMRYHTNDDNKANYEGATEALDAP